ncbi:VOC family protein [Nocardioides acrostichi]|uniref:VOC family protein n=1 Tax=Nocardioides acrostichi TaxID=2784339 RepID=A0A930YBB6_9ACTN|nr:VOC family protein [Nocardioides acrostichi]MBF4162293.1 VOC family protein [Nocardioides acrostichi]
MTHPRLLHTALDAVDARGLAEFYRALMGLVYRDGDEPRVGSPDVGSPDDGSQDDADWLVLLDTDGHRVLAVQQVDELTPTTWPDPAVPMQAHQDWAVPDRASLETARERAEALGARVLLDRTDDPEEALYVLADPAGHPFCLLVGDQS